MTQNNNIADGIVLLAKKPGLTSFASLNNVKKALNTSKVGHTGTLDSFAQGLLVVCTGRLTKLAGNITEFDKAYSAVIKFGEETDTLEYTGQVIKSTELPVLSDLKKSIEKFTGKILQAPPSFSAIHVNGKRASDLARNGQTVEIPKREVTVFESKLEEVEFSEESKSIPNDDEKKVLYARISFTVSKGTYIRSLARDIGADCGSSAHLIGLLRTKVGNFLLKDACGLEFLENFSIDNCKKQVDLHFAQGSNKEINNNSGIKSKYVPTLEDELIKAEIIQKKQMFSKDSAIFCGFIASELSEANFEDFIHGRPLSFKAFLNNTELFETEKPRLIAVFCHNSFLGLMELAKNNKFYYRFVLS